MRIIVSFHGQYCIMIFYLLFWSLFLVNIFVNVIVQSLNSQIALIQNSILYQEWNQSCFLLPTGILKSKKWFKCSSQLFSLSNFSKFQRKLKIKKLQIFLFIFKIILANSHLQLPRNMLTATVFYIQLSYPHLKDFQVMGTAYLVEWTPAVMGLQL